MKTAIVFDWTNIAHGGAERVLEQIIYLHPDSDLYCIAEFVPEDQRGFFQGKHPATTFIQKLPFARRHFRMYVPLFPIAIEQLDLRRYDLVISSSHAFARGVVTGPDQVHVCYCHSPIRSAWDMEHEYRTSDKRFSLVKKAATTVVFHYIRMWEHAYGERRRSVRGEFPVHRATHRESLPAGLGGGSSAGQCSCIRGWNGPWRLLFCVGEADRIQAI